MKTFEIPSTVLPNLDGFNSPQDMRDIRTDLKELSAGVLQMANYCEAKEHAIGFRLKGEIEKARKWEGVCDAVFARLPEWARW